MTALQEADSGPTGLTFPVALPPGTEATVMLIIIPAVFRLYLHPPRPHDTPVR